MFAGLVLAGLASVGRATPAPSVALHHVDARAGAASPSGRSRSCVAPTMLTVVGGRAALGNWSLARLAEQTVVIPVDESDVAAATPEVVAGAGGVILFGLSAPANLPTSLATLAASAPGGIAPLVMTDEEGGAVQRMANLVGSVPSPRTMGKTMTARAIAKLAQSLGRKLLAAGVTMDLAPVLDVDGGPGPNARNPDGSRSFSPEEPVAAADGLAFAAGLERAGIVPVVKHFPGLGGSTGNTDLVSASTPAWLLEQRIGLVPFVRAITAHIPAIMVADAKVPGLSSKPASISEAVITGELRQHLHFSGLVLTDSLSAQSIRTAGYSVERATVAALVAGADMVLYNAPTSGSTASLTSATVDSVVGAVRAGMLRRRRLVDAVAHILAVKRGPGCT